MGISGNLKTMQLSELLQWLALGQKTGTLLVEGHGVQKRLYFENGRINFTSSSDRREYLGQFLVSHGYITEDELKKAMEVQEESKILLGRILLMINAISETDLLRLMRRKAEESIYDIFLWEDGTFEFAEGEQSDLKMVPLSLDLTGIILEGLHRYDEWKMIRQRVPDAEVVPMITGLVNLEDLAERERLMVPHIDGQSSIEEIALQTHNAEFSVARFVYEGLTNGWMVLADAIPRRKAVAAAGNGDSIELDVENFLERGRASLREDPQAAYRMFKVASDLAPFDGRATEAVREAEREIRSRLDTDGVTGEKVPELAISITELTERTFSPHEGFVLSRINSHWDVKAIMKISPMKELEVMMIFQRLWKDGVIRWKGGR
ncbi:MAG TPA: DUF4388 domain-containing protein [Thermoanaerobaculia bacterium]|nr:DUF4388 domain-containing protein [Thermoanaerobaculia bacterium]